MKCSYCGAEIPLARGKCEYCGTAAEAARSPEVVSRDAVFEKVFASREYAKRNSPQRHAALPTIPVLMQVFPILFFVLFIGVAGFIAISFVGVSGAVGTIGFGMHPAAGVFGLFGFVFALVPIGFVVLGVFLMKKHFDKIGSFQRSSIEGEAAIIVGKRTAVSGGGNDSSVSTSYFITVEFPNGRRREFATLTPDLYGKVAEGDAGVFFTRESFALDFDLVLST